MVKKLFKHEIAAYLRLWLPIQIILFSIAGLSRVVQFFESNTIAYSFVFRSSIFMYVVGIIAAMGFVTVYSIVRYYKNLFSGEGYLTFTLPVTPTAHILVKLLTSFLFTVATLASIFLSFCLITAGEVTVEVFKAAAYVCARIINFAGVGNFILYIIEAVVMFSVTALAGMLLYYVCITLGQLFNKHRVLAAVGIYYAQYVVTQILSTIFVVVFAALSYSSLFEAISEFIVHNTIEAIHIMFCMSILFALIIGTVYFFITKLIIRRRLNLE